MLQQQRGIGGTAGAAGWSSAYTVQSILIQLQSFLFEEIIVVDQQKFNSKVQTAIKLANDFNCTTKNCRHSGKLTCWPSFPEAESAEVFRILEDE